MTLSSLQTEIQENREHPDRDRFTDFFLSEYDNIAQAHFKTIDTISEFFKHYLTILTLPIPVVVVAFNIKIVREALITPALTDNIFIKLALLLFFVISFVGLMVYIHILNLRWDALLYARTVNGIRKYFFDYTNLLQLEAKARLRVLPQSPYLPIYREFEYFGPVVITFGLLNSLYFYLFSILLWLILFGGIRFLNPIIIFFTAVFGVLHYALYIILAEHRENKYLRSNTIGVDIDGVLNLHRDQFCKILKKKTNKTITPEQITKIPVKYCPDLKVTGQDEIIVFNEPSYWTQMPCDPKVAGIIRNLRNSLQVKIHIFTSRPWPITNQLSKVGREKMEQKWKNASRAYSKQVYHGLPFRQKVVIWLKSIITTLPYKKRLFYLIFRKNSAIDNITMAWLEQNHIEYDRLMVEKGSEHISNLSSNLYNRFLASKIVPIRYFVEDDLLNAGKLAYICDFVFLINQPYNQSDQLLANVIRVDGWEDIYEWMKKLG